MGHDDYFGQLGSIVGFMLHPRRDADLVHGEKVSNLGEDAGLARHLQTQVKTTLRTPEVGDGSLSRIERDAVDNAAPHIVRDRAEVRDDRRSRWTRAGAT